MREEEGKEREEKLGVRGAKLRRQTEEKRKIQGE